jgi:hypothetical protein
MLVGSHAAVLLEPDAHMVSASSGADASDRVHAVLFDLLMAVMNSRDLRAAALSASSSGAFLAGFDGAECGVPG